jgi:hypothetical protein
MSRLTDWWRARRWPWWSDAMKVARDFDAEARATFTDDTALGLGRIAPAPGESPATTEQVPVLLLEPRMAMVMANPETGEATDGQVEAIIKAGLQRLIWPAALVKPAAGWTLQRTADGIELLTLTTVTQLPCPRPAARTEPVLSHTESKRWVYYSGFAHHAAVAAQPAWA